MGLSPRFSGAPRLRRSNRLPGGPRIWFLGRGAAQDPEPSTRSSKSDSDSDALVPGAARVLVPEGLSQVRRAQLPPRHKAALKTRAIKAGLNCRPPLCSGSPICIARLAIEREQHGRDSGEIRRLLNSLECKQDEYAKSMILHSITRCVYLLEAEASACTTDDIGLVGSMLDDKDNSVKIQALNALKALSGIRKFRLKIQEHSIKVLELISTIWDSELHVAGLRLLNNLPLPDFVHPQLRRVMPALMEILQSDYILAQVQAIRLLSCLAQKNDLLYDILNCQVHSNFLNLLQCTQPGSLLFEILVFAERLSEGRNSPHYCAVRWRYSEQSLHEALFGEDSRLADRLLALVIHPEEDVQIQACRVIVSLQCPPDVEVQPSACQLSHSFFNNGE
ncbi:Armadillo repeat-containing protein 12 [Manis javanica]|nr:Armadillo repeat-containing protein 12 [Manis javanica]